MATMSVKQLSDSDKHRPGGARLDHLPRGVVPSSTCLARELTFERPSPPISELVAISLSPSGDEARLISEERQLNKEKSK